MYKYEEKKTLEEEKHKINDSMGNHPYNYKVGSSADVLWQYYFESSC